MRNALLFVQIISKHELSIPYSSSTSPHFSLCFDEEEEKKRNKKMQQATAINKHNCIEIKLTEQVLFKNRFM